jgi:hypothetical protein
LQALVSEGRVPAASIDAYVAAMDRSQRLVIEAWS